MTFVHDMMQDSTALLEQTGARSSTIGDFWALVEQAGPLRWPIFIVLGIGLVLVIGKLYELLRDRSLSAPLFATDLRLMTLPKITAQVSSQRETMLASVTSAMLNVFHTRPTEGMLHDEIANYLVLQQDQFSVFRRRMEFLSDTAGALGLMGTVWGMFVVFFQGTTEKDVILRGMGIALITTLLGLVVSIVLNLAATELSTFFGRRLAQTAHKANELRFRLLELAVEGAATAPAAVAPPVRAVRPVPTTAPETRPPSTSQPAGPAWCYLEGDAGEHATKAGETLRDIGLTVRRQDGTPAIAAAVVVVLPVGGGTFDGGTRELRKPADAEGRVRFSWTAPERAGRYTAQASVAGQPGPNHSIELQVGPAAPQRVEVEGNNQAAVAGMRLPNRLGVRATDRFGNPVPGVPVVFTVKSGNGRFDQHGKTLNRTTDAEGWAGAPFAVASEAGPNVVVAAVDGGKPVEFVAFGTEL